MTTKYQFIRHDNVKMSTGRKIRFYEINDKVNKDNMKVPSVTTILGLIDIYKDWRKNNPYSSEIMLYAQIVGIIGHWKVQNELAKKWGLGYVNLELNSLQKFNYSKWIEEFPFSNKENGIRGAMEKITTFYDEWNEKYKPEHPYIEKIINNKKIKDELPLNPFEYPVISKKFGYAGSIDILSSILIDEKIKKNKIQKRLPLCIIDIKTTKNYKPEYKLQTAAYLIAFNEMHPEYKVNDTRILYLPKNTIDWNYAFPKFRKNIEYYKIKWLEKVAEFYMVYGDEEPLCFYKEDILNNIEKMGIELSELKIQNKEDYFYENDNKEIIIKDKNKFLDSIR